MAKQDKRAAMFDLFDLGSASQPGERQTDLEALISERDFSAQSFNIKHVCDCGRFWLFSSRTMKFQPYNLTVTKAAA